MPGPYHIMRASAAAATAINTAQAATNDPTATNAGAITVPADLSLRMITAAYGGFAVSTWTTTATGSIFGIRLTGNGVVGGQQDLAVEALQAVIQTSGTRYVNLYFQLALFQTGAAIGVVPNNTVTVQFFQISGVSQGTWSGAATFVFV